MNKAVAKRIIATILLLILAHGGVRIYEGWDEVIFILFLGAVNGLVIWRMYGR